MILTTDDFSPANLEVFHFWDSLRKKKNFSLLAFTTADWKFTKTGRKFQKTSILEKEFIEFCNKRSDWLNLAYHGLTHEEVMLGNYKEQERIISDMLRIFEKFQKEFTGEFINAYKPPFYKYNVITKEICRDLGIKFFFIPDGILNLRNFDFYRRDIISLVDTHTNPEYSESDAIQNFYKELEKIEKWKEQLVFLK